MKFVQNSYRTFLLQYICQVPFCQHQCVCQGFGICFMHSYSDFCWYPSVLLVSSSILKLSSYFHSLTPTCANISSLRSFRNLALTLGSTCYQCLHPRRPRRLRRLRLGFLPLVRPLLQQYRRSPRPLLPLDLPLFCRLPLVYFLPPVLVLLHRERPILMSIKLRPCYKLSNPDWPPCQGPLLLHLLLLWARGGGEWVLPPLLPLHRQLLPHPSRPPIKVPPASSRISRVVYFFQPRQTASGNLCGKPSLQYR